MKHAIYYFTGTGNSLDLARSVAEKTGGESIIPIAHAINERLPEQLDTLGIVCPNYAFNIPHIVRRFIKKIISETKVGYLYLVISAGGTNGNVVDKVKNLLRKFPEKAVFTLLMPYNYPPIGDVFSPEKEQSRLDDAKITLQRITKMINERKTHFDPKIDFHKYAVFPGLLYMAAYPFISNMAKSFWVTETCNGCGICKKVCPVQNITIEDKKPRWHSKCEQCFACYNWCPKKSVHSGKSTQGKGHYTHPGIKIKEMYLYD